MSELLDPETRVVLQAEIIKRGLDCTPEHFMMELLRLLADEPELAARFTPDMYLRTGVTMPEVFDEMRRHGLLPTDES